MTPQATRPYRVQKAQLVRRIDRAFHGRGIHWNQQLFLIGGVWCFASIAGPMRVADALKMEVL